MSSKANLMKVFFCVLALTVFAFSKLSYADWSIGIGVGDRHDDRDFHRGDHDFYRWHDHPHYGYRMHFLPDGCFTVLVGGVAYYYYDGLYYVREGFDYVLVSPPIGAYVNVIPPDFQPVSINGRIYYTDNGVYYILTQHHGYKVVPQPVVYAQPVQVVETQPQEVVVTTQAPMAPAAVSSVPVDSQDTFPINIPNNSGGYTTVVIKKSGNGFVGPQGEFYATFPTVAQLKAMYVK